MTIPRPRTSTLAHPRGEAAAIEAAEAATPGAGLSTPERALLNELKWLKLPTPDTQYRFTPPRRFTFDFAWPAILLACEVEGGHWIGGHGGVRFEQDCEKYNLATIAGWRVIRVTPRQITSGEAVQWLEQLLLPF